MDARNIYFNFIVLPLIRLFYKLRLFVLKKSLKLRLGFFQLLKLQIRRHIPESRLEGHDLPFDRLVHLAAFQILDPEILSNEPPSFMLHNMPKDVLDAYQALRNEYKEKKMDVENLVSRISDKRDVRDTSKNYLLIRQFNEAFSKQEEASNYYLMRAREIDATVKPLEASDLWRLERSHKKQLKEAWYEITDKEAIKISLTTNNTGLVLSLVSTLFLISGYLYNRLYLGAFDIDVSRYFSVGDYLAASIESIEYAAIGSIAGAIGLFMGLHYASRKSPIEMEYEQKRNKYVPHFIFILGLASVVAGYFFDRTSLLNGAQILIPIGILMVPVRYYAKYFKEPLIAMFSAVFVVTFFTHLGVSAGKDIRNVKRSFANNEKINEFIIDPNLNVTSSHIVLLSANSQYYFFRDYAKNISLIIPKDKVLYVHSHPKKESRKN